MRLLGYVALLIVLLRPAIAAETTFEHFPFETKAGTYRNLIVYADDTRALRLVFPSVAVERPSADRAVLRPGGNGRVVLEIPSGKAGAFETGAELYVTDAPLVLRMEDSQTYLQGAVKAVAIPLVGGSDPALGRIVFDGMTAALSWPTDPATAPQVMTFALKAAGARVDAAMLALPPTANPKPLVTGPVETRGRLVLRVEQGAAMPERLARIELDRAEVALFGGGVAATGTADFPAGIGAPPDDLEGILRLAKFTIMMQRIMESGLVAPEQLMPLLLLAGTMGDVAKDGTVSFAIRTGPQGALIVNDRPTAIKLGANGR